MDIPFPSLPPIPDGQYRTVLADPPWAYDDDLPGPKRGSSAHYDTLHAKTVAGMGPQIRKITDGNCHLYLWVTNSFLAEGLEIMATWGFDHKTMITWVKVTEEPAGLPHEREDATVRPRIGMGHYFRNATEHLLFGVKGNLRTASKVPANVFFAERNDHSSKPEKSYALIEEMSQGPRIELFARGQRDGWDSWGAEA
jgi:Transcriptional activator, adenine-specific DNA methyltransferase